MKPLWALFRTFALRIWQASGTKYLVILAAAGIWIALFDRYNLVSQQKVARQIEQLRQDKAHYEQALEKASYERERFFTDMEELERYAREQHLMKRPNEDLYIVTEDPDALRKARELRGTQTVQ
ncbi:MAG: hypothetical protein NW241_14480 [Bacteroidia bacterium]|nr:hypothetical protein [Bacteroidia bacterium]